MLAKFEYFINIKNKLNNVASDLVNNPNWN